MRPVIRAFRAQDGAGLVEVIIAMVLMGVVGGIATAGIIGGTKTSQKADGRVTALNELELTLERVTRDLRAANPIWLSGTGDYGSKIGAHVTRDGVDDLVIFEVVDDGSQAILVEQDVTVDASGSIVSINGERTLIRDLATGTGAQFTYLTEEGGVIDCIDLNVTLEQGRAACEARHLTAARVTIALTRELQTQKSITVQTSVSIRNTRRS